MKLEYEKINKENIIVATKIQYEIFPNASAYSKYKKEINSNADLPIDFLVYDKEEPIGVVRTI